MVTISYLISRCEYSSDTYNFKNLSMWYDFWNESTLLQIEGEKKSTISTFGTNSRFKWMWILGIEKTWRQRILWKTFGGAIFLDLFTDWLFISQTFCSSWLLWMLQTSFCLYMQITPRYRYLVTNFNIKPNSHYVHDNNWSVQTMLSIDLVVIWQTLSIR